MRKCFGKKLKKIFEKKCPALVFVHVIGVYRWCLVKKWPIYFVLNSTCIIFAILNQWRNVAQLVAHYVRDVGVGRSSRLIPTKGDK